MPSKQSPWTTSSNRQRFLYHGSYLQLACRCAPPAVDPSLLLKTLGRRRRVRSYYGAPASRHFCLRIASIAPDLRTLPLL